MGFSTTPGGTRGARGATRANALTRLVQRLMIGQHRRKGDKFLNMDVLYLTTVGAKSGRTLLTPLAYFRDGTDAWLVVASAGGAARNPSWYYNLAAHPETTIEVGGQQVAVVAEQLDEQERAEAWPKIVEAVHRFAGYETKTDRVMPVLRLVRQK